ncbi:MAG: LysE family translocator, partial [Comamonadaceae bacterium]
MIAWTTLGLFALAALALLSSPGPNMAFVLAQGAAHGPRGAFAGALGIAVADFVLALAAASGVAALVAAWAPAFDLLRWAGAAYLVWLGVQALRAGRAGTHAAAGDAAGAWRIARMGFVNTLMNPKALIFFIVFLP